MDKQTINTLMEHAREAVKKAYCPYSHFPVGAALLTEDGKIYTGVNVENVSFGATNCAERSAIYTAVSEGYRPGFIKAIAVAGETDDFLTPCSICRQVLVEMAGPDTPVYLTRKDQEIYQTSVRELVPMAFQSLNM
ncbi:cytidine deaminase [Facklamia miroungae]|uniref:Cytidine deaminase n=1 Tax=Facklamia miroungae TaxID=120956 RepID=A0A1G7QTP5_9LACT|nr:cytidine deaminase [Facklamia miroungae]NKZ29061.1 cytidine deaminase [Facklamia miroungae]SDG01882.1 cytidine deaminase [Facklamia miroungae]